MSLSTSTSARSPVQRTLYRSEKRQQPDENLVATELCQRCRDLGLSAADFFVPAGEPKWNPEADDIYDPLTLDVRPWESITQHQSCSLCRLIQLAAEASRDEWQALETPSQCKMVSKRLTGSDSGGPQLLSPRDHCRLQLDFLA